MYGFIYGYPFHKHAILCQYVCMYRNKPARPGFEAKYEYVCDVQYM